MCQSEILFKVVLRVCAPLKSEIACQSKQCGRNWTVLILSSCLIFDWAPLFSRSVQPRLLQYIYICSAYMKTPLSHMISYVNQHLNVIKFTYMAEVEVQLGPVLASACSIHHSSHFPLSAASLEPQIPPRSGFKLSQLPGAISPGAFGRGPPILRVPRVRLL